MRAMKGLIDLETSCVTCCRTPSDLVAAGVAEFIPSVSIKMKHCHAFINWCCKKMMSLVEMPYTVLNIEVE